MKNTCMMIVAGLALAAATTSARGGGLIYDESLVPRLNIPRMQHPPTVDGTIDPAEWKAAARVSGVVTTHSLHYKDRPVSFCLGWDAKHLYIAARSDVLPGTTLLKSRREGFTTGVVFDDAYEFGIFMHDRNKLEGEVSSFLKIGLRPSPLSQESSLRRSSGCWALSQA